MLGLKERLSCQQNVRSVLAAKGIQTDRINELMELLDTCERFRYSPSPVEGGEVVLLQKAEKLVMIITEKK